MSQLADKVCLVTGGASGIGAGTVRLFAERGARVVVADLQEDRGQAIAAELNGAFARTDVTKEADVAAAVDLAVERFGRLDCVFNNAGFGGALGPIDETTEDDFDITFDVLLKGVFFGIKHAARVMKPQGSGSILNTASVAGLTSGYAPHLYSVAKAAVITLTETTALEMAEWGVRVNAICPGFIATPLAAGLDVDDAQMASFKEQMAGAQPVGRVGEPQDHRRDGGVSRLRRLDLHHRAGARGRRWGGAGPAVAQASGLGDETPADQGLPATGEVRAMGIQTRYEAYAEAFEAFFDDGDPGAHRAVFHRRCGVRDW